MMAASENMKVTLAMLLEGVDVVGDVPDIEVTGIAMDSRQITAGDVFLACAGFRTHGRWSFSHSTFVDDQSGDGGFH